MDTSFDFAIIALLLISLLAYIAFCLWKPKHRTRRLNKPLSFLLGLICSILLSFVYLLGFILGGIAFMMFGHTISYVLAGICSILLCAHTINILPQKIGDGLAFHSFCALSFVIYLLLGIGEIAMSFSPMFPEAALMFPEAAFDIALSGIFNIGVALCAIFIHPISEPETSIPETPSTFVLTDKPSTTDSVPEVVSDQAISDESPTVNTSLPENVHPVTSTPVSTAPSHISIRFSINKKFILVVAFIVVLFIGILLGTFLGEGYFIPQFTPSSPYIDSLKDAEKNAASTAYSNGYKSGYASGQIDGYNSASEASRDAYSEAWLNGWDGGYNSGYEEGYNAGYDDGYYAY